MLGELSPSQIEDLLQKQYVGRIGCHSQGRTYVVPVSYAYDGQSIVVHSPEGMKLRMMRDNPDVCFEVDRMESLTTWQSVIAWGRFEEIGGDEARQAMMLLIHRLQPLLPQSRTCVDNAAETPHSSGTPVRMPVLYRIRLQEKTGRFEDTAL